MKLSTLSKNKYCILVQLMLFVLFMNSVSAVNFEKIIINKKEKNSFTLSENGKSIPLFASSKDWSGVLRVLKHLQMDLNNVTNARPDIFLDTLPEARVIVIVGTLGQSPVINELVRTKKIDLKEIEGKWDSYLIQVVEKPIQNIERALVIVGSNKRGTIYGMYDLSSQIGVSPWYWWADVPVKKQNTLYVKPVKYFSGEPKVKYRGIFINDEAPALSGWSYEKFGGFNSKFYEHVFELILRLKGNFLWPAMWGNAFYDDDPENPRLADEYGVVISTSHHEPMMRAHAEWARYGSGKWNYEQNENTLQEFWRKGIDRMGDYESVVTLAMRGDGDEAMSPDANVSLLQRIVEDQRKILAEATQKEITTIPQVWALYKEVQEYYDKGMRVPDDVTLLLCDDNWGNVRKLPNLNDKPRAGGYGMYYHFDFVGGPRNYKWLNTNQIERVWEQMHLTYKYGVDRIWIVNIGDIKPMEFPIEFFLDFAWDPDKITADMLPDYTKRWAEEQFASKYENEIAEIMNLYTKFNSRKKPEMLFADTYSLVDYKEWETVANDFNNISAKAENIYNQLPAEYKDAFFQLVLHPTQACANLNEMYLSLAKNRLYIEQGRASANYYADKVQYHFNRDALITDIYNKVIASGKWSHMMDQVRIGYTNWQQPPQNIMPEVKRIQLSNNADMGVAIEDSRNWWPKENSEALLPEFDPYLQQRYYIDIFNRGKIPFTFSVESEKDFIQISKRNGKIEIEERIWINIDWKNAPKGKSKIPITVKVNDKSVVVNVQINNPETPLREKVNGFVESNNYISIEAMDYSNAVNSNSINWITIPNLGRTCSAVTAMPVTAMPVTAQSQTPAGNSPHLEYQVYLFNKGEVKVKCYFSPILNFGYTKGIRYAVSFDDEAPQVINVNENDNRPDWKYPDWWNQTVSNNIRMFTTKHNLKSNGEHVLKFWMVDPGLVLQKIVVETGNAKQSYLGPPQSYNRTLSTKANISTANE